jgi:hypothetical protein
MSPQRLEAGDGGLGTVSNRCNEMGSLVLGTWWGGAGLQRGMYP